LRRRSVVAARCKSIPLLASPGLFEVIDAPIAVA